MNRYHLEAIAIGAMMALPLVPVAVQAATACATEVIDERRAWEILPLFAAEEVTKDHRLIGLGCGPEGLTMTAQEEDLFPASGCYAIGTVEELCEPEPQFGYIPTIVECARYLGDGW